MRRLLADDSSDFLALVLTGKNDKLREELTARYAGDHRVQAVPFTREVNLYMNASDVLITKPGRAVQHRGRRSLHSHDPPDHHSRLRGKERSLL